MPDKCLTGSTETKGNKGKNFVLHISISYITEKIERWIIQAQAYMCQFKICRLFGDKRREFAELFDDGGHFLDDVIDLLFGVVSAQAEAD